MSLGSWCQGAGLLRCEGCGKSVSQESLEVMMWINREHVHSTGEAEFVNSPVMCLLPVVAELEGPRHVLSLCNGYTGDGDRSTWQMIQDHWNSSLH